MSRQFLNAMQHDILALVPMTEKVTSQLIDFDRKIITSLHLFRRLLRMYLLITRDRLFYLVEESRGEQIRLFTFLADRAELTLTSPQLWLLLKIAKLSLPRPGIEPGTIRV